MSQTLRLLIPTLGFWVAVSLAMSASNSRSLQQQPLHVKIGSLIPFYQTAEGSYGQISDGGTMFEGFQMAVEEINADSTLLPNIKLLYNFQDSKVDEGKAFFAALTVAEWGSSVVIGPAASGTAGNAQLVFKEYQIPQISYSATSAALSNKQTYPYFLRTPPSDALQAEGLVALVQYYNWTQIATFSTTDGYGSAGIDAVHASAERAGITVLAQARFAKNQKDLSEQIRQVKDTRARIFVLFCAAEDTATLLEQAYSAGLTGDGYVYIGGDAPSSGGTWNTLKSSLTSTQVTQVMTGYIGMLPAVLEGTQQYESFRQRWSLREPSLVESSSGGVWCSNETDDVGNLIWMRSDVDGLRSLGSYDRCAGVTQDRFTGSVDVYAMYSYDAVYLAAHALHQLIEIEGRGTEDSTGQVHVDGEELLAALYNQSFAGVTGQLQVNENGDRVVGAQYKMYNHQDSDGGLQYIGDWDGVNGFSLCDPSVSSDPQCRPVVWSTQDNSIPQDFIELVVCAAGERMDNITRTCQPCAQGSYSPGGDTLENIMGCIPCAAGTFSPQPGMGSCLSCDVLGTETYQDKEGEDDCERCPENSERRVPSTGTTKAECVCKNLHHQPEGLEHGASCEECPAGASCAGFQRIDADTDTANTENDNSSNDTSSAFFVNSRPRNLEKYWGDPLFPVEFYDCEFCQAGFECEEGHEGRMCFHVEEGHATMGGVFFWECPGGYQSSASVLMTLGISLAVLLFFFFVNNFLCNFESIDVFLKNVRVLAVASLFPLNWETRLNPIILFFKFAMFDVDIVQPNCLIHWSYYESFWLQLIVPTLMGMVYFFPVVVHSCAMKARTSKPWKFIFFNEESEVATKFNKCIGDIINVSAIFYPTVLLMLMASFKCTRFSNQKSYLDIDPTMECGSSKHLVLQIVSVILLPVVLFLPVLTLGLLLRSVKNNVLHKPQFLQRYGGLYQRYRVQYLWWEPLYILKVTLLVTLQVFGVELPLVQAFVALLINSAALAGHFYAQPFVNTHSNILEAVMIFASSIFIVSGNLFFSDEFGSSNRIIIGIFLWVMIMMVLAMTLSIAAQTVKEDLDQAAANKLVSKLTNELIERQGTGDVDGIQSARVRKAILAPKVETKVNSLLGDISNFVKKTVQTASSTSLNKIASTNQALEVESQDTTSEFVADQEVGTVDTSKDGANEVEEVSLELQETASTLSGHHFKAWLLQSAEEITLQDLDRVLAIDEWIAPYVSDDSHTSMYSRTETAYFWRNMEVALPDLMEWFSDAQQEQVRSLKDTFTTLCSAGAHSTKGFDSKRANYLQLISEGQRASVLFWLCDATHEQRKEFFKFLRMVLKANGIDATGPGYKGAKIQRRSSRIDGHESNKGSPTQEKTGWMGTEHTGP